MNNVLQNVQDILRFENIPCWLMYCDEHSDPYFSKILSPHTTSPAVGIITQKECWLIAGSLDIDNVKLLDNITIIEYSEKNTLWNEVDKIFKKIEYPEQITLNYSTILDTRIDVLGFGLYSYISNRLKKLYSKETKKISFCSAENMIYALSDRKSERDISRMRISAKRAMEIIESAFAAIKPGMSELEIMDLVHSISEHKPSYFKDEGIISQEYSWEPKSCPIVMTGPNLVNGEHTIPSQQRLERGHTIYLDFGVKLTFQDGESWSSDIQRMGYVLKDNENDAPDEVKNVFRVLVESISAGIEAIKPGIKGYKIDEVVREYILKQGYPDYKHSTGHSIGKLAHNPGTLLGHEKNELAKLRIQQNGVYTIEPRIAIVNGGSIEEMVLVRDDKSVTLCERQMSLYLIK